MRLMYDRTSKYYVGNVIIKEAKKVANEALMEEIHLSFLKDNPQRCEQDWLAFQAAMTTNNSTDDDISHSINIEESPTHVDIAVSADMGWQKRSSGKKYDSPSGHMFLVSSLTGKIVDFELKCVSCSICSAAQRKNESPRSHYCWKNFDQSAKAMEATTAAELVTRISEQFNGKARVGTVISDDDSTMRAHCSHKGGLSQDIHEPTFLADPSHRCKIIGKALFKLASKKKSECTLSTNDAIRLKVYCACFFNINRDKNRSLSWMQQHVWCIVHHLFDDHQFCTDEFCYKKREADTPSSSTNSDNPQESDTPLSRLHALRSKPGYYKNLKNEEKLFYQLKDTLARFFTGDAIKELMHGHNTQTNEGLNTSMIMTSPKFKNFSRSSELATRVALVSGCHNLGKHGFISRVIDCLQFTTKPVSFLEMLRDEDHCKARRQVRQGSLAGKKNRITKKVSKALDTRIKDIRAFQRGTFYGQTSTSESNSIRNKKESICMYKDYGCNTPGHTHKTLQSQQCMYHYLWKDNQDSENPEKLTKNEWFERIKALWESQTNQCIPVSGPTQESINTVNDVITNEFSGDFTLLSNQNSTTSGASKNSSTTMNSDDVQGTNVDDLVSTFADMTTTDLYDYQFGEILELDGYSSSEDEDDEPDID